MARAPLSLVADIGGTHSRLALARGRALVPDSIRYRRNDGFTDPAALIRAYLTETGARPAAACIAAAGPVRADRVQLTNHAWAVDQRMIRAVSGATRVLLLNDLQAMGYALALPEIAGSELGQPRLVLAIGTGLNAAIAHRVGLRVFVPAGESGHISLPFTGAQDCALLDALSADFGACVAEAGLSGAGLSRIHRLLTGADLPPEAITAATPGTQDSLGFALLLLGRVLASLSLVHLPYGGIWLAGSVGRALAPYTGTPEFKKGYFITDAYKDILKSFEIRSIDNETAQLSGAALALDQDHDPG